MKKKVGQSWTESVRAPAAKEEIKQKEEVHMAVKAGADVSCIQKSLLSVGFHGRNITNVICRTVLPICLAVLLPSLQSRFALCRKMSEDGVRP